MSKRSFNQSRCALVIAASLALFSSAGESYAQVQPEGGSGGSGGSGASGGGGGLSEEEAEELRTDMLGIDPYLSQPAEDPGAFGLGVGDYTAGGTTTGGTTTGGTTTGGTTTGGTTTGGTTTGGTGIPGPGDITMPPIIDTDLHPCDRPPPGILTVTNCSLERGIVVGETVDNAGYIVWRALQLLDVVLSSESEAIAAQRWQTYFSGYDTQGDSLQNWFGNYSHERASDAREAFADIWAKYLGPGASGYQVECYKDPEWWQWGLAAKYAFTLNPCLYTDDTSAHHWYKEGPQLCDSFFESNMGGLARGALLVHELLHRTWIDGLLVQDAHYGYGCEMNDGVPKCYSRADSLLLSQNGPEAAVHNNSSYEYFGLEWAERYTSGNCGNFSVCSGRDLSNPSCQPVIEDPPTYPECDDPTDPANFGLPGCPCADVDVFAAEDAAEDGGYPDGAGSYLKSTMTRGGNPGQYCEGAGVVCDTVSKNGQQYPICRTCDDEAQIGCPCDSQSDCASGDGLSCYGSSDQGFYPMGSGTCLPDATTVASREKLTEMPWFCLDNCAAINNYGQNGVSACVYDQIVGFEFAHGTCVNFTASCDDIGGKCEEQGKICGFGPGDVDQCQVECQQHSDCAERGFPESYLCDALGNLGFSPGHCVHPDCINSSSEYCNLYR